MKTKPIEKKKDAIETRKASEREAKILIAIGKKGVGKTYTTLKYLKEVYQRKTIIFDTNGEFEDIAAIRYTDLNKFRQQRVREIRRLLPVDPNTNAKLGIDGKAALVEHLLDNGYCRDMCLYMEDLNSFLTATASKQIINLLTTNRHYALDVFIHLQSLSAITPRLHQNVSIIRMHKILEDDISRRKEVIANYEMVAIAKRIVDEKYKTDPRFYLYIDQDNIKLTGAFTYKDFRDAAEYYFKTEGKKQISNTKDYYGVSAFDALERLLDEKAKEYLNLKAA